MSAGGDPSSRGQGPPVRIRIASGNPGKAAELGRLVRGVLGQDAAWAELADTRDIPGFVAPAEDATTYAGNALIKVRAVAGTDPQAAVVADDSGLEVDALAGEPGLRSARWATGHGGQALAGRGLNDALLARMGGLAPERRGARLVACVAVALPGAEPITARGEVRGAIAFDQRGISGFGYDAVFVLPDGRRLSDLAGADKDRVSHRGQALRGVGRVLRTWVRERTGRPDRAAGPRR